MNHIDDLGSCWFCERNSVEEFFAPVDNALFFENAPALICRDCGFIYKKASISYEEVIKKLEKSYYGGYSLNELLERSRSRAYVDISRSAEYINMIGKYTDLSSVKTAIDIGGAEGLFSHVLKTMHPNIEVYCLEPDKSAIEVGKQLYPEVNFLDIGLEQIDKADVAQFDLFTYFGGFYRTNEPLQTLKKIQSVMQDHGLLVFSLPFTIDQPSNQAEDPYEAIDDILGNASFLMLDRDYMRSFIERHFELVGEECNQHVPYFKKIPFFIAKKTAELQVTDEHQKLSKYDELKDFVYNYADRLTAANLQELVKENQIRSLAIFGTGQEAQILGSIAGAFDIQEVYHIDPQCSEETVLPNGNMPVKSLAKIHDNPPDLMVIADYANQDAIYDQLVGRVHLDRITQIVKGFSNRKYANTNAVFEDADTLHLQKAFVFRNS